MPFIELPIVGHPIIPHHADRHPFVGMRLIFEPHIRNVKPSLIAINLHHVAKALDRLAFDDRHELRRCVG